MDIITTLLVRILIEDNCQRNVAYLHSRLKEMGVNVSPSQVKQRLVNEPYFRMGKLNYYAYVPFSSTYEEENNTDNDDSEYESISLYNEDEEETEPDDKMILKDNPLSSDKEFCFDSVILPKKAYEKIHDCYEDSCESRKFKVTFNCNKTKITNKNKLIYSLSLKLLNRGTILPASEFVYDSLDRAFVSNRKTDNESSAEKEERNSLSIGKEYTNQEKDYIENVLLVIFGDNWSDYVTVRPSIEDILGKDARLHHRGKYVDFFIEKNNVSVAVCFDDDEYDTASRIFKNRNVHVTNDPDVNSLEGFFHKNATRLKKERKRNSSTGDFTKEGALAAFRCEHQISIAILKALEIGCINPRCCLKVSNNGTELSDGLLEKVLAVSIEEVEQIINSYSRIYGIETETNLSDKRAKTVTIGIGSNATKADISISSFDCNYDFCARIETFPLTYSPKTVDISALKFFLKYIFNFDSFQDGQEKALECLLLGKDSIVLLPTGAGKSLIFQLSSYILPGLIVVISPLRALINDQVNNLKKRHGIDFAGRYMREETSRNDVNRLTDTMLKSNVTSLLYVAPERMQIPKFRKEIELLLKCNNICAVAIDEAHCISEWGHDFRPAYLNIGRVSRQIFKKGDFIPTLTALTGTASDNVLKDVKNELDITGRDSLIVPASFDRKELKYSVVECSGKEKTDYLEYILEELLPESFGISYSAFIGEDEDDTEKHPGIIFAPFADARKQTQYGVYQIYGKLSQSLPEIKMKPYFSKSPRDIDETKWISILKENAEMFKNNDINLLVATKAYGMGIDKENIRFIIHNGLPSSIEQYYQEAGRAGRDRKDSKCILLFSNDYPEYNEKMLDPSLSIGRFNSEKSAHRYNPDDLHAMLFFHGTNFRGIEEESIYFEKITELLKNNFKPGESISVRLYSLKPEDVKYIEEKEIMRALIRFQILGIISDYTYDYSSRIFTIVPGSIDKEDIISKYREYISVYNIELAKVEESKLKASKSTGWNFVDKALVTLVEYIYDTIEKSRRSALRSMFELACQALKQPKQKQDAYIRKEILNYLQVDAQTRDEIEMLITAKSGGLTSLESFFALELTNRKATAKEKEEANKLRGRIGRYLESYSDHPGLLLLRELAGIKSEKINSALTVSGIVAAFRFALDRYGVSRETVDEYIGKVSNYILDCSSGLFKPLEAGFEDSGLFQDEDYLEFLLRSRFISKKNQEYLLLTFFKEKLLERIK